MLYPIMSESRSVMDLSGIWDFRLDNGDGFAEKWYERPLPEAEQMPVPASYNDLKEDVDFRDHCGYVFYQKRFSFPKSLFRHQRIVLRCEAVTHFAKIYLNGKEIGSHLGGFLPFEFEIGKELQGENLLTIAVDNRIDYHTLPLGNPEDVWGARGKNKVQKKANYPNFDFFNYCGITRPVRLLVMPESYIDDITIVPEVEITGEGKGNAVLRYSVDTCIADHSHKRTCRVEILDREGNVAGTSEGENGKIDLQNAVLWQPLKPYLYRVKVQFGEDVYELPYGIRTVEVRGTEFLINGKAFYFKGYGKHEDTFPHGRGENIPMYVKDFSLMKWQGANSFRCSHYPYSEEMMRLCDEEGIVLIDETTAVGINFDFGGGANFNGQKVKTFDKEHGIQTFDHHMDVIRDLISRDKNYACVVMWNIANEPDSYTEGAYEYFEPLYALAKQLDPEKRPCTLTSVQMAGGPDRDISAKLSDVICLNRYYGWYYGAPDLEASAKALDAELKDWQKLGKPLMFSEYGADTVAGLHDVTPVMYTEEYQVEYYKMNNALFDQYDYVVGEHAWNFADFATSQSLLRIQGNKKDLFTRDRKPKMVAHYFKERWNSIPDFNYKG